MSDLGKHWRTCGLAAGMWVVAAIHPARADDASCDYSKLQTADNSVVISANSGAVLSSRTSFSSYKKPVDLYFVNKNSFGYSYSYAVKGTAVEDGIIVAALTKIGILTAEKSDEKAAGTPKDGAGGDKTAPPPAASCGLAAATAVNDAIVPADQARLAAIEASEKQSAAFDKNSAEYDGLLDKIRSDRPETFEACSILKTNVKKAPGFEANASQSMQALQTAGKTLADATAALKSETATLESRVSQGAPQECKDLLKYAKAKVDELEGANKKVSTLQKSMSDKLDTMKSNNKTLSEQLSQPDTFITRYPIGPDSEPMSYEIKITRTARKDNAASTYPASAAIKLGTSRFSFSAGAAYAFGDQKTYARQASVVDDEIVNVVGVTEDTDSSVGVVGQINGRFYEGDDVSWMWSLGASLTNSDEGAQFGFYTGPTLAIIGDKLFFTLAYHLREETDLSGGFEVGDVVPEDLEGEIPTTKKTRGALLLSVTWKVQ